MGLPTLPGFCQPGSLLGLVEVLFLDLDMPLRGTGHSKLVGDNAPYFKTLAELDDWVATPSKKLDGVLGYKSTRDCLDSQHQGKLLVQKHLFQYRLSILVDDLKGLS